jgi:hypothetical protein
MDSAYSGALVRSAHFAFRPPVPGISPNHETQTETGDIFNPVPETPENQGGDAWMPRDASAYSDVQQRPFSHWAGLEEPVPSNVHLTEANQAATDRMLENHSRLDYVPDLYPPYLAAGMGRSIEWITGRTSLEDTDSVPDNMSYLVAGKNAYSFTNGQTEVYSADQGNRRLGVWTPLFGRYDFWTKQGQEADLRAYTGLTPSAPYDKPRIPDSSPYTPNSSGTTTWVQPSYQDVSLFTAPNETVITDYTVQTEGQPAYNSDFSDSGSERM